MHSNRSPASSWTRTLVSVGVLSALLLAPAASSLEVATRSIKARPSEDFSPHTAWDEGHYGCSVTIAVLDDGIDDEHPSFEGKPTAAKDTTGTEPAWDQVNGGNPQPVVGNHGTPVGGIAVSNAGKPFSTAVDKPDYRDDALVGVAPCAHLVDIQFTDVPVPPEAPTDSTLDNMVQALEWAVEHRDDDWGDGDPTNDGIDIITMSWSPNDGTDGSDPVCRAATRAVQAGIVVLGSAGNSGEQGEPDLGCPTGADGVISVANLDNKRTVDRSDDALHPSSAWGPRVDDGDGDPYEELKPTIAAPGHRVVSTGASLVDGREYALACFGSRQLPDRIPRLATYFVPKCEHEFGGTSAATPMAAGVVALVLDADPDLSPAEVTAILQQTADPHDAMERSAPNISATWDQRYGHGMIDAHAAVEMAKQWPGLDLGRDLDADGVRDPVDAAPADPANQNVSVPAGLAAVGGDIDTDGDGQVDATDPAPLDPHRHDATITRASTGRHDRSVPGAGPIASALSLVVATGLSAARRSPNPRARPPFLHTDPLLHLPPPTAKGDQDAETPTQDTGREDRAERRRRLR